MLAEEFWGTVVWCGESIALPRQGGSAPQIEVVGIHPQLRSWWNNWAVHKTFDRQASCKESTSRLRTLPVNNSEDSINAQITWPFIIIIVIFFFGIRIEGQVPSISSSSLSSSSPHPRHKNPIPFALLRPVSEASLGSSSLSSPPPWSGRSFRLCWLSSSSLR